MNTLTSCIVYLWSGADVPLYLLDTLYQNSKLQPKTLNYVVIPDQCIEYFRTKVELFDVPNKIVFFPVENIPCSNLQQQYETRIKQVVEGNPQHFDGEFSVFWQHTITRYFVLHSFMKLMSLSWVLHLEIDNMLYIDAQKLIKDFILPNNFTSHITCVQHNFNKPISIAIGSIVFVPEIDALEDFLFYTLQTVGNPWLYDMQILGNYTQKHLFPAIAQDNLAKSGGIFDGACIGQYLGGLSPANTGFISYTNTEKGHINDSGMLIGSDYDFVVTGYPKIYTCKMKGEVDTYKINNIHVHSKQLCLFSSFYDTSYEEIITGERIQISCDITFSTRESIEFHKSLKGTGVKVAFYDFFDLDCLKGVKTVFIYTHHISHFIKMVLPILEEPITLYTTNSDDEFNCLKILDCDMILKVYATNCSIKHPKLQIIPIGIANSMYVHGDLTKVFSLASTTYFYKKTKKFYININENTHPFRNKVMDVVREKGLTTFTNQNYNTYLNTLNDHMFCLCIRGNGNDTHRFWEALYLGVIPVLISDEIPLEFLEQLTMTHVPFIQMSLLEFSNTNKDFFNEKLYNVISKKMYCLNALKLTHYCK